MAKAWEWGLLSSVLVLSLSSALSGGVQLHSYLTPDLCPQARDLSSP